jgi:hypothetical protein
MSATNRGSARNARDHYPTPPWLTEAILPLIKEQLVASGQWPPIVYEPACGDDLAIVKVLQEQWPEATVEYSDLIPMHGGVDFLKAPPEPLFNLIITNPPFKLAREFYDRSRLWLVDPTAGFTSLLLRVNFLGGKGRAKWLRKETPHMGVTPKRPVMGVNKHGKPGTDATEYAWLTWPGWNPLISILETEDIKGR